MVKKIVSIALVAFAGVCMVHGQPVKSSIGARTIASQGGRELTAKDYVQDGLVVMFDGIENVGWGEHDGESTTITELVSGKSFGNWIGRYFIWTDNAQVSGTMSASSLSLPRLAEISTMADGITFEFVCMHPSKDTAIAGPRLVAPSIEGYPELQIGNLSLNRYNEYWNFAASAVRVNTTPFGYTPKLNYGTGHTITLVGIKPNRSVLYCDGFCIGETEVPLDHLLGTARRIDLYYVWPPTAGTRATHAHNYRIYSRALTAEEIAHNYVVDKQRFNLAE